MENKKKTSQFLIPAVTLLIGLIVGYFVSIGLKKQNTDDDGSVSFVSTVYSAKYKDGKKPFKTIRITPGNAATMMAAFRKQNDSALFGRLETDSNQNLHGFWIPKAVLDTILERPGLNVNGLRIYLGKRSDAPKNKRAFSLILLGTSGPKNSLYGAIDSNTDLDSTNDPIYDHVDPCPNACGDLNNQ
jgi:hypothetical protein